jgi:EAL domain-containing protein (putative c-di-GMP-specific phosphodiesterase class I)
MAQALRLTVVAEGVETAGQLALLAEQGCDQMQGYYFSKPVPAADFGCMLLKSLCMQS